MQYTLHQATVTVHVQPRRQADSISATSAAQPSHSRMPYAAISLALPFVFNSRLVQKQVVGLHEMPKQTITIAKLSNPKKPTPFFFL